MGQAWLTQIFHLLERIATDAGLIGRGRAVLGLDRDALCCDRESWELDLVATGRSFIDLVDGGGAETGTEHGPAWTAG